MAGDSYGFLDKSILSILNQKGIIDGDYEQALVDLHLMGVVTDQTNAVLLYFLDKAIGLGYLTDITMLGFVPESGLYYFGTVSQLGLVNADVVKGDLKEISRKDWKSWKDLRSYDKLKSSRTISNLKALSIVLGVSTAILGVSTTYQLYSKPVSVESSVVSPKNLTTDLDSNLVVRDLELDIASLSVDYFKDSATLSDLRGRIGSLSKKENISRLYGLLSSKLTDINLYNEINSKLSTYPTDSESYVFIEKGISSISDSSNSLKEELFSKLISTKEYVNSIGYEV